MHAQGKGQKEKENARLPTERGADCATRSPSLLLCVRVCDSHPQVFPCIVGILKDKLVHSSSPSTIF